VKKPLLAAALVCAFLTAHPTITPVYADSVTDQFAAAEGADAPLSIYSLSEAGDLALMNAGQSQGTPFTYTTPLRIASVTKTFTAATVLRLVEQSRLDIGQPITAYVDSALLDILRSDGYAVEAITVKHLLTHTGGLADHAQTQNFFDALLADPAHRWSRKEQVQGLVDWADPVGRPGMQFAYSDTGYILLGHIIEKITGQSLAAAVRQQLGFDALGLKDTYWELAEDGGTAEVRRAHQFFQGHDTHGWSATLDHYGGGGLVSTTNDLTTFFSALFGGNVFRDPATLDLMLSAEGLPAGSEYRLGIFVRDMDGVTVYEHSGFWGTLVFHVPAQGRTIAGAVLHQKHYKAMREAMVRMVSGSTP